VSVTPSPKGTCPTTSFDPFSDVPDGSFVEKGGAAEVIRKGNNPPATDTTPTNAVNRTIYTVSNPTAPALPALVPFDTTSSGLAASLVDFTLGKDVNAEVTTRVAPSALTRPSLHGDVIHSRPLPLNYGGTIGTVVYYGANDGALRAVDSATGKERWAFIAPEHYSKLQRLMDQSPLVKYPNQPAGLIPTPLPKDYFFDGSIGAFQNPDSTKIWIFAAMRRGGRMVYALDVTNPANPAYKWKVGCPNAANDTGCTAGFTGIGQTWSMPSGAFIKGYSTTAPVVIFGGGYDACEDADVAAPACSTPKGNAVYVVDANNGTLIKSFTTPTRSVVADVALIDVDGDSNVDYAFVVDTGGNIYRIDFVDSTLPFAALDSSKWTMQRVAYTNGASRKFLFPPALLFNSGKVYVAVGSGDREHPLSSNYPYTMPVVNRFYVYKDDLSATVTATNLDDTLVMMDKTTDAGCADPNTLLSTSLKKGWFMSLNANGTGEQTVTSVVIAGGMAIFSTNRPIPSVAGSCSTVLGEARGYFVNVLTGSGAIAVAGSCGGQRSGIFAGGGLPPSPVIGTLPIGGAQRTVVIGAIQKSGAASSPISSQQLQPPISRTRKGVYWYPPGSDN
jgi:type IV pilus assembly protein PilY1